MIFLVSNNGTLINLFSLLDIVLNKPEKEIYYSIQNSSRITDKFESEEAAELKYTELISSLLFIKINESKAIPVYAVRNLKLNEDKIEIEMRMGANSRLAYNSTEDAEMAYDNLVTQLKSLNLDGSFGEEGEEVPSWVKNISLEDIRNWNNKSEFDGKYESLNGLPKIPENISELTNDLHFITFSTLSSKLNEIKTALSVLEREDASNETRIENLETKSLKIDVILTEIDNITASINALNNISVTTTSDISSIFNKIDNINKHLSIINGEYQDVMEDITKIKIDIENIGDTLDGLNTFVTTLIGGEGSKITDIVKEINNLKLSLEIINTKVNKLPTNVVDYDEYAKTITSLNSALIFIDNRIETLLNEVTEIKNSIYSQEDLEQLLSTLVPKTGGTMTGRLSITYGGQNTIGLYSRGMISIGSAQENVFSGFVTQRKIPTSELPYQAAMFVNSDGTLKFTHRIANTTSATELTPSNFVADSSLIMDATKLIYQTSGKDGTTGLKDYNILHEGNVKNVVNKDFYTKAEIDAMINALKK